MTVDDDESVRRSLNLTDPGDLGYLRGLVDSAGWLSDRADLPVGPLTAFWREVVKALITVAEQAATSGRVS